MSGTGPTTNESEETIPAVPCLPLFPKDVWYVECCKCETRFGYAPYTRRNTCRMRDCLHRRCRDCRLSRYRYIRICWSCEEPINTNDKRCRLCLKEVGLEDVLEKIYEKEKLLQEVTTRDLGSLALLGFIDPIILVYEIDYGNPESEFRLDDVVSPNVLQHIFHGNTEIGPVLDHETRTDLVLVQYSVWNAFRRQEMVVSYHYIYRGYLNWRFCHANTSQEGLRGLLGDGILEGPSYWEFLPQ